MSWTLKLKFEDDDIEYSADILEGATLKECVGEKGKHATQSCSLSIYDPILAAKIFNATENVDAKIMNGTKCFFEGIIRPYATLSAEMNRENPIQLEVIDYTEILRSYIYTNLDGIEGLTEEERAECIESRVWTNKTISELIQLLFDLSKVKGKVSYVIPEDTRVKKYFSLEAGKYLDDIIEDFLYNYSYDFRFTPGKLTVFSTAVVDKDHVATPATVNLSSFNLSFEVERDDVSKDGVKLSYGDYHTKQCQIYNEVDEWGYYTENMLISVGSGYYYKNTIHRSLNDYGDNVSWSFPSELDDKTIIAINNPQITGGFETSSKYGVTTAAGIVRYDNNGGSPYIRYTPICDNVAYLYTGWIKVDADVIYKDKSAITETILGLDPESYSAEHVESAADARLLATNIQARNERAAYHYSFSTFTSVDPGTFVSINENAVTGLSTTARIVSRIYNPVTGLYQYEAEGAGDVAIKEIFTSVNGNTPSDIGQEYMMELTTTRSTFLYEELQTATVTASGLVFTRYQCTPKWTLNDVELTDTTTQIIISKSELNVGVNTLKCTATIDDAEITRDIELTLVKSEGADGDPAPYTLLVYKAASDKPDTPSGTSQDIPKAEGWSLEIPTRTGEQVIWVSSGVVDVVGGEYQYYAWSEPSKLTADSDIVPIVQWKWGSSDTINPDEEDNTISLGDGTLLEVNGQAVTISQNSGTGWSNTIPAYSDEKPYLWKREWRYASEGVDAGWVYYCVTGKQGVEGSYNSLGYKIDGSSITFAGLDRDGIPSLGSFRANLGGEVVAFQRTVFTITSDLDGNWHERYFLVAHWTSTVGSLSLCYLVPVSETDDDGNTTYRMKWVAQDGTEITTTSVDGTVYDPYVLADIRMVSGASIKSVTLVNPAKLKTYESDYFMTIMAQGDMTDINVLAKALDIERVYEKVAAMEAFINKLFANEITITNTLDVNNNISKYGSIHSSGYNKLDYTDEAKKGFYLESTGYAEFSKAILKDATIESQDSDGLPILATSKSYDPFEMDIHEEATYWKLDDLFSNVDIKKYGYIEFTSDYEAIHAPLSTYYELYNSIVNRFDRSNMFSSVSFEYEFTVDFDISKIRLYLLHQFTKIADTSSMNDSGIYVNDVLVSSGEWVVDTTKYDEYKTSTWGFAYKEWQYSYYIAKAELTTGEIAAGSKIKIKINVTDSAGAVMFSANDTVDIYANPNNFEAINGLESDYTASTKGYVLFQKKANSISLLSSYIFTYWNPKEHMLALDNFDSNYYAVYRPINNGFLSKIYNQLTQYVIYKCDSTKSYLTYNNETIKVNTITREDYSVIVNSGKIIPADSIYAFDAYIYVPEGEGVLVTKTILPASSNAYDLGSETSKFRNIYAENLYPVGSFYFSTRPTSPASIYGGTWAELDGDRTLWFVSHTDGTTTTYLEDGTGDNLRPQKDDGALPALSGWFTSQGNDNSSVGRRGCDGVLFKVRNTGTVDSGTSSASDYANAISFDANRYNSIYGKLGSASKIVRPTHYKVYAWWRRA